MNRETYLRNVEEIKDFIKSKTEQLEKLKQSYIDKNKPCELEQLVKITRESGRVSTGVVKGFGILNDKNVYVTSIKPLIGTQVYISVPYLSIEILSK
jgi:hypothetical protein